jgi:ubiquinone/menaquinone biosynthesis C-methylase UbiE
MAADVRAFVGGVPANYDKFMVPMLFVPYALEVAQRLRSIGAKNVLEIAAGTGALTRAMAAVLGPDARITATDLNQPMLDVAMQKQGADSRITWRQADGLALPFGDAAFDAVACQFGVMFYPDKAKGYGEVHRVLQPRGRFIFDVWDKIDNNEFVSVLQNTLADLFPADPPRFMERLPHGYYDLDVIGSELKAAGFSSLQFESVDHISHAASAFDAVTGYCAGSPLGAEIEARAPGKLADTIATATEALAKRFGRGPIQSRISAHIITAAR